MDTQAGTLVNTEVAARPDAPPDAPRPLGALFGDAARLYARHWRTFLPAVLLLEAPLLAVRVLAGAGLDPGVARLEELLGYTLRAMPFLIILNLLDLIEAIAAFILMGIVARQIVDAYAGRTTALGQAIREVLPRLRDLLGGSALMIASVGLLTVVGVFLVAGLTLVFLVVNAGPGGLAAALARGLGDQSVDLWRNLLLLLPILLLIVFLIVRWALMVQVVVLETGHPWGALRRSWRLVRGHFWRVLAVLGLASLPITLLQNGPMLYQTFLYDSAGGRGLVLGILYTVTLAARLLILPWVLVLVTLLYFDLRLRHGERALP